MIISIVLYACRVIGPLHGSIFILAETFALTASALKFAAFVFRML
jgi:hypothetical protein